jgi:glycosyltransferase involved in cell wall biosynthesis
MRIALVHSYYSSAQPSGENAFVDQHLQALRRSGVEAEIFALRTDELIESSTYTARAAIRVATGLGASPHFGSFAPDVVHVHNLFPNYGNRWISRCNTPIIASLHNFRPMCAAGTLFRDGHTCFDCPSSGTGVPAVIHGCYKGPLRSVPVALGQRFARDPLLTGANLLITPTAKMAEIYRDIGVPESKMRVIPHFLPSSLDRGAGGGGDYWIYAGRLTEEKGILDVVRNWPGRRKLVLVGEGPLAHEIAALNRPNVEMLGSIPREDLMALLRGALGLLFPSKWFEGFGLVYLEALAAGTPVLAWKPSVVSDFVELDGTGRVATGPLEETLSLAEEEFPALRRPCRAVFESRYTEKVWVGEMLSTYDSVIGGPGLARR